MLLMWGHIKKSGRKKPWKSRLLSSNKEEENREELKTILNQKSQKSIRPKTRNACISNSFDFKDPRIINLVYQHGKLTPFVCAAYLNEDINVFEFLLEKTDYKNPILRSDTNSTLLHNLVRKGHLDKCRLMMKAIKDKSPQDKYGSTPYHIAAGFGHVELCRLLMEYHIDKNPRDREGKTPLCIAAIQGHLGVCRLLMETCVDQTNVDESVKIPLHIAALNGHVEVFGLFMANVSDKNLRINMAQDTPVTNPTRAFQGPGPAYLNVIAGKTYTPLESAIAHGNLNVCKLLIEEYKVDVNTSDNDGMTPLHLACKMGNLEICKFLCEYVQNKNTVDNNGRTPLDLAILEENWDIVFCMDLF